MSSLLISDDFDALYRGVLMQILQMGDDVSPRGKATREIRAASLTLQPPGAEAAILRSKVRRPNYYFMVAEHLWIVAGMNSVEGIRRYNPGIAGFSDDGATFAGAYGPKVVDQLPYVLDTLRKDPDSRQALLTIWRERPRASADIPCTVVMQFFVRGGLVDMVVYMRSNDAWLGLPYDVYNFTQLQRAVAGSLGLGQGEYHHIVGSLHLYEQHYDAAAACAEENYGSYPAVQALPAGRFPLPSAIIPVLLGQPAIRLGVDAAGGTLLPEPYATWATVLASLENPSNRALLPLDWQWLLNIGVTPRKPQAEAL